MKQAEVLAKVPRKKWAATHEIHRGPRNQIVPALEALVAKGTVVRRQVRRLTRGGSSRLMWEYRRA